MSRNTALKARINEAEALALRLNEPGITYDEIAERLGLASRQSAHEAVNRPLRRTIAKNAEEYLAVDLARTEAMLEAVWGLATNQPEVALQYTGKGADREPLLSPETGEHIAYVIPAKHLIESQQNVIKLLERRAKYGGLDHSDKMAERQVQLQESQVELFAMGIRAVLDALDLTPEQKAREPEIVARQLALVAGQAIETTATKVEDK